MHEGALVDLPVPGAAALAHSDKLRTIITDGISHAASVTSFSRYMERVLYEPGLGYYMAGAVKIGAHGDFTTAPEVTPLYGAAMGNQALQVLEHTGGGILELGAGTGSLALGLLQSLDDNGAISYTILEPSAELADRQRDLLSASLSAEQFDCIQWIDTLPDEFTGVIIANEVMDALPVERFKIGNGVEQLCVSSALVTDVQPATEALENAVEVIQADLGRALPVGYCSEVSLLLKPWLASLETCLAQGVLLLIDYGYPRQEYYLEERYEGTLTCYYRHRAHHDPYLWPGLQDITAHVDFTAVVEIGVSQGMDLLGYSTQSAFLLDNQLLALSEAYGNTLSSEADRIALARAIKTLTLPGEMGERFQVMALGKRYDHPLHGFRTRDLSYRL